MALRGGPNPFTELNMADYRRYILRQLHAETEIQLYGAWRAGYDFLYVVEDFRAMSGPIRWHEPSNDGSRKHIGYLSTRYDLRESSISPDEHEWLTDIILKDGVMNYP